MNDLYLLIVPALTIKRVGVYVVQDVNICTARMASANLLENVLKARAVESLELHLEEDLPPHPAVVIRSLRLLVDCLPVVTAPMLINVDFLMIECGTCAADSREGRW